MTRYPAAVIGLGNMGMLYDIADERQELCNTHCSGFFQHPGFELIGGVDPKSDRRRQFQDKYRLPAFPSAEELFARCDPRVVSLAVPIEEQYKMLPGILAVGPSAVLCEKPLADSWKAGAEMVATAKRHGTSLLVNYVRRFDPGVNRLKQLIDEGALGNVYKGTGWYTKGIKNNGSHYIDLLRFLLGEVGKVAIVDGGRCWTDADPEPDLCLEVGGAKVYLLAAREEHFTFGQLELMATGGLISYKYSGLCIETRKTAKDSVYGGYTVLSQIPETIPHDMNRYQWHVVDHLYDHLLCGTPLVSDGENALKTLAVLESALQNR